MPIVKVRLVRHIKLREDNGNIVEIKMWQIPPSPDKPHGYKYSLVYIVKGERVIGYDNAEGRGDHRHTENRIEPYRFRGLKRLADDFYRDIENFKEGKRDEGQES